MSIASQNPRSFNVVDSHTGGEPTRIVVDGGPDLGRGSVKNQLDVLQHDHDWIRTSIVNEPRGSDVMVGGVLCEPEDPASAAGVIFFNNVGYLNMCGHGMIGTVVTLAHLGRISEGTHTIETSVGPVTATLEGTNRVTIENVPSYRTGKDVAVEVPGIGTVVGDVAWGGNWFYLIGEHGQTMDPSRVDELADWTWRVRRALENAGITGEEGAEIDHLEIFGEPTSPEVADSQSFVLCPGRAYDRSPCGTGTSAKLACLAADGKLDEGDIWKQQSIIGSVFEGRYRKEGDAIIPIVTGTAFVNSECRILLNPDDPFACGIPGLSGN